MKSVLFQFFVIVMLLIVVSGCDKTRVFEEYQPIPDKKWHKDSVLLFVVPVSDTLQNHNLFVNVRNDIEYGYSNLWLFIEIEQPGNITKKDTFEFSLAHPSGKWLGEGFGGIKTLQVIYKRNVFFPKSGNYTIKIQQGMRDEILNGISDIGFRIETIN